MSPFPEILTNGGMVSIADMNAIRHPKRRHWSAAMVRSEDHGSKSCFARWENHLNRLTMHMYVCAKYHSPLFHLSDVTTVILFPVDEGGAEPCLRMRLQV